MSIQKKSQELLLYAYCPLFHYRKRKEIKVLSENWESQLPFWSPSILTLFQAPTWKWRWILLSLIMCILLSSLSLERWINCIAILFVLLDSCSFVTEKTKYYWSELIKTDGYKTTVQYMEKYWTLSMDYVSKYWSIVKEYLIKYWNAFNTIINDKVGYNVLQKIQESIYYKKVAEVLLQMKDMMKPSAIYKFLDTLRLSLQMTPYVAFIFCILPVD